MSDTPETDDHDQEHAISGYTLDFCRKLERERDEARERADTMFVKHAEILDQAKRQRDRYRDQADSLVDRLGATQERSMRWARERDEASNALIIAVDEMVQVQSQLREAKREFDEARDTVATMEIRHAAAMFHAQRVVDDANQLREQLDKLAAVLRKIRDGYGGQLAAPNCCEDCDFLLPIDEALESLTNFPQTPAE